MITTWLIFEMAGTIAFAFSGAAVGLYKRMDIFGITVLSVMTAVGGGMIRDVLCGITPPSVLRSPEGLIVSIVTALVVGFGYPLFRIPKRGKWVITILYHLSDTIGLAAFTVTGALTAFYRYPGYNIVLPIPRYDGAPHARRPLHGRLCHRIDCRRPSPLRFERAIGHAARLLDFLCLRPASPFFCHSLPLAALSSAPPFPQDPEGLNYFFTKIFLDKHLR